MNSINDKIITRVLINERMVESLKVLLSILKEKGNSDTVVDLFKQINARNMCRDFEYNHSKALEVLGLNETLEEATKIIN